MTSALAGAGMMSAMLSAQAAGYQSSGGRPQMGGGMNVFAPVTVTNNINAGGPY